MYRGNLEILKLLISSIDLEDPYHGIAELAYDSCALGHIDILEHFVNSPLLKEKTIESITEQFGLWAAYQEDRTQMVEFLLYNLNIQPPSNYKQEIKTLSQIRIDDEDWTLQEANEKTLSFITMIEKRDKIFKSALDTTENLLDKVSKSSNDFPKPKLI